MDRYFIDIFGFIAGAFNLAKQDNAIDLQELRDLLETTDTCKSVQSNGFSK